MTRDAAATVTGIGLVTAAGHDTDSTWAAVRAGRATARPDPELLELPVSLSCRVDGMDALRPRQPGTAHLDPGARMGLAAAAQALDAAKLDPTAWDATRVAVVTGCSVGGVHTQRTAAARFASDGPERVSPYFLTGYLPNMVCAAIALHLGATGPTLNVATACASGATALGTARDLLASGQCDIAVVVGADAAVTPLMVTGFSQLRALSDHCSRPFDRARDGFVIAEGAGALILERPEHAAARSAPRLARLIGYGASSDAHHLVAPHPEGHHAERALRAALAEAGVAPGDVGHVNAHGTSTPRGDAMEATLLARVFPHRPPVTSTKGSLGHTLGAAGAIEAALTVLALREDLVPPTAGLTDPDPALDIDVVADRARPLSSDVAVSNSFGFGGHNAVVVLERE
ncbi:MULTISPECIES: beta-ketoacyl-[acyl-carrier-protein] synthase family protein [Streptomyces]|uniref:3-oxoacyl-ACP synthase n=3 Tax=Streptomyces TaxID=1883 RepID=A0A5P2BMN0_STRVZ|nr:MULTISPECIES: beta-ketoacyl-[acyl-carrier-protein] synthase family protein [Streptomyces]MYY86530.1 beta-ketoacyl-ACP synthase II [Streptomyces sp. SID335]NEB49254.1 beta-ketoacyl-[acyl-carrier-protein] synthase family protein [Streptomyces sp. SID339]QES30958.1 3-oxoacyl-ACP synthase [Streptomyces venezuelae]